MALLTFDYYVHDNYESSERAEAILDQLPQVKMDYDDFSEAIGRPFNEIRLKCTLDTSTMRITIDGAEAV